MDAAASEDLDPVLRPLLRCLETLAFIARNLNPPDFEAVMHAAGRPDDALRAARAQMERWPGTLAGMQGPLAAASDAALAAFEGLHTAPDQENGLLADAQDPGAWARAIGRLFAAPTEAHRLGQAARRTVEERFTIERVTRAYLGLYDGLLGNGEPRA